MEILKVGLSTPSVSWGDASILENRGNIDDDDDDDGILVNDDEEDDDGDYDEKQLRELGAGRPAPCLAGNQLISHHRSNQDNDDDGDDDKGDVDNDEYDVHKIRVCSSIITGATRTMMMTVLIMRTSIITVATGTLMIITPQGATKV